MKKQNRKLIWVWLVCVCMLLSFTPPKGNQYKAYLACTYADSVQLASNDFKQFIMQSLCVKDTAQQMYKVHSFDILYAERGLYQDDEGLPIIVTDYSSGQFTGDTLNMRWKKIFQERSYSGDTVYIDNIKFYHSEHRLMESKGLKIILK